ncbi:MAG TPA: enoyl-CoA hydratase/isomerase family protein [Dehalococcoidia bacterium]|nr:enoyl-CoA hydratase/isomerase family protein [Dehalococcoidia bacterium]
MAYETLLLQKKNGVGIITLNRPAKLNALSTTLLNEFDRALTEFEEDGEVDVLLVTGAGDRAFSAGADIHEMVEVSEAQPGVPDQRPRDWVWHLANYRKPTIGVINGLAHGGGALMSSIFDIRLGCERTNFRFLAVSYGRVNSTWSLPLIVGLPMAKELLFTGRIVEAEEAFRIGLLNRLVPSAELMKTALEMAELIASNDASAVQAVREMLVGDIGMNWYDMLRNEARIIARSVKSPPPRQSFSSFLERKGKRRGKGGD